MNINTTDKVQVGESTTGTSTSTTWHCPYTQPKAEQGWECPRCGRINAPWKSQCDCVRNNYWTVTDDWIYKPYNDEWWKHVYCDSDTFKVHPETTIWKAPSSVCTSDGNHTKSDNVTAYNIKVGGDTYSANSSLNVGGSDYYNSCTRAWENIPKTETNKIETQIKELQNQLNNLKETK